MLDSVISTPIRAYRASSTAYTPAPSYCAQPTVPAGAWLYRCIARLVVSAASVNLTKMVFHAADADVPDPVTYPLLLYTDIPINPLVPSVIASAINTYFPALAVREVLDTRRSTLVSVVPLVILCALVPYLPGTREYVAGEPPVNPSANPLELLSTSKFPSLPSRFTSVRPLTTRSISLPF
ncbi:hypothetical protein D3C73_1113290 [compost metagenome]